MKRSGKGSPGRSSNPRSPESWALTARPPGAAPSVYARTAGSRRNRGANTSIRPATMTVDGPGESATPVPRQPHDARGLGGSDSRSRQFVPGEVPVTPSRDPGRPVVHGNLRLEQSDEVTPQAIAALARALRQRTLQDRADAHQAAKRFVPNTFAAIGREPRLALRLLARLVNSLEVTHTGREVGLRGLLVGHLDDRLRRDPSVAPLDSRTVEHHEDRSRRIRVRQPGSPIGALRKDERQGARHLVQRRYHLPQPSLVIHPRRPYRRGGPSRPGRRPP